MPFKIKHPLYSVWRSMIHRCTCKTAKSFKDYGGRGISVCSEWLNDFHQFVSDMGDRPAGYTIDRINNNGNYEHGNCRWSSRKEQQRNQRVTRKITICGTEYIAADIAEKYGFKTDTIVERAKSAKSFDELVDKKRKVFISGLAFGGKASGAKKRAQTHCKYGHEFTEDNTRITPQGWRVCRKCHAEKMKARNHIARTLKKGHLNNV